MRPDYKVRSIYTTSTDEKKLSAPVFLGSVAIAALSLKLWDG